jgi:hypothetical protein
MLAIISRSPGKHACRPLRGPLTRSVATRPFGRPEPLQHAYRMRGGRGMLRERSVDAGLGLAMNLPAPAATDRCRACAPPPVSGSRAWRPEGMGRG